MGSDNRGALRRSIRALHRQLGVLTREEQILKAQDDDDRAATRKVETVRRKFLSGMAVLYRVLQRRGMIRWLRRVLDRELVRLHYRELFGLEDDGPLIPREDWPGWPDLRPVEATLPDAARKPLSPARRQARLAFLRRRIQEIQAELAGLTKEYAPHRDARNEQRMIVVGAVLLTRSFRNPRITQWLRALLDRRFTATRDRSLFVMEHGVPLVPAEDQAGLRRAGRRAAKEPADGASPAAGAQPRRPTAAPSGTRDGGAVGEHGDADIVRNDEPDSAREDAVGHDAQETIPGWQPRRLRGASASRSGGRTEWGARLSGLSAVAQLPEKLVGRAITVTDSNGYSWTTPITGVVSREDASVVVRTAGRPGRDGAGSRPREEPDPSSS